MKKRILSFLLAAVMLVGSLFTTSISAEETLYPDVAADRWSAADIAYVTEKGMMQDTGDGEFEPSKTVTRAMVVTVLYRLAGSPKVYGDSSFTDVPSDQWYADPVIWGASSANKIVTGFSDRTFRPNEPVTREQLVTFIGRFAELNHVILEGPELVSFLDSDSIQSYALEYFKWAVAVGLVKGMTENEIRPSAGATREQFAAIMHRFDTSEEIKHELYYSAPTAYSKYTEKEYPLVDDADFYVSVDGDDSADGKTTETAFKTFERARKAVNEFKKTATEEIKVAFMAGDYGELSLTFTSEDSGTEDVPITYCAYGDGDVIFNNGVKIYEDDFSPISDEDRKFFMDKSEELIKKVDLSGVASSEDLIAGTLFSESGLCATARYPDQKPTGASTYLGGCCRKVSNDTIQVLSHVNRKLKEYHSFDGVIFAGKFLWEYHVDRCSVLNYDPETGNVTLSPTTSGLIADDDDFMGNKPFYIENAAYELDHAGEYWIDRETSTLYVYDPQGTYELAYGQKSFITTTDGAAYLTFRGFDFSCASGREVTGDFIFPQYTTWKDISATAALNCTANSRNITVDLCSFTRMGSAYAVFLDGYSMSFTNNEIFLCAGGGIYSNCGDTTYRDELTDYKKLIDNNLIHSVGLKYTTYHHGIYSWDAGAVISHNEIYDIAHFALEYAGVNTIFEYNVMYRCNTHIQDAGMVYSAQFFTRIGNVIRYNLFYESDSGFGLYIDNGLSGQTVYGNLFYNASGGTTLLLSGGRQNYACDNIIIYTPTNSSEPICANAKYYGMAVDAVERGLDRLDSSTWSGLDNGPYTIWPEPGSRSEEIWKEAHPWLYELIFDFKQYENPKCAVNAANCTIKDNISFSNNAEYAIHETVVALGEVDNNVKFTLSENPIFKNPTKGDYSFREDADISVIGELPDVPFEKMGRY